MDYLTVGDREKRALVRGRLEQLEQQHFQLILVRDVASATGHSAEVEKFDQDKVEVEIAMGVMRKTLEELPPEDPDNPDPPTSVAPARSAYRA